MTNPQIDVTHYDLSGIVHKGRPLGNEVVVRAGNRGKKRVVPPAGKRYAFDRQLWDREVTVYVSPTGRSVRVYVDGAEIKKKPRPRHLDG